MHVLYPGQIEFGAWRWFLRGEENRSTRWKILEARREPITNSTHIWWHRIKLSPGRMVGGERSHRCKIPASLTRHVRRYRLSYYPFHSSHLVYLFKTGKRHCWFLHKSSSPLLPWNHSTSRCHQRGRQNRRQASSFTCKSDLTRW